MKKNLRITHFIGLVLFLNGSSYAQPEEWNIEKTKDGKTIVKNRISSRAEANGKEIQVVEYVATTVANVSLKKLVALMKDVSKHKDFMGQKTSMRINPILENECGVYYYYKGVWPYPNSDIAARMLYHEDPANRTTSFTLTAAPDLFPDQGVRRLDYYNISYYFKDLKEGNVEITISARFTPAVQLPAFMTRTWFPDGPADYLRDLIRLVE